MTLSNKSAIITGAASGIGRATAELFAERGARVLAVDLDPAGLESLAEEGGSKGQRIETFVQDLTAGGAAEAVFAACTDRIGRPDVLVNVAGRAGGTDLATTSDEDYAYFLSVNLGTTFSLARRAVIEFADGGGAIVNTSSAQGVVGMQGSPMYAAAKAGIDGLTRQLAAEYGPRGIRVNSVAPGLVETPATAQRIADGVFDDAVTKSRPLPYVATARDIACAYAFLASDDASSITGVTLPVCGGWTTTRFRG